MSTHTRDYENKSQRIASLTTTNNNDMYAVLRDEKNNILHIVPRTEIISAKKSGKVDVGDTASHGVRDKRIRGTIVLLGSQDQCLQSVQIIERTKKSSTQINNNKSTLDIVDYYEEQVEIEDQQIEESSFEEPETDEDEEATELKKKKSEFLSNEKKRKEKKSVTNSVSPLSVLKNISQNESSCLNTESSIVVKRKSPPSDPSSPVDKSTIQYFIHVGKVLANDLGISMNDSNEMVNKEEILDVICAALEMSEAELAARIGQGLLSTARQVISAKISDVIDDDIEIDAHFSTRVEINATDIASSLVLLKKKHRLSTDCIKDILRLLKILGVANTPSSWYKVKELLSESKSVSTEHLICPGCNQITKSKEQCTNCSIKHSIKLQSFRSFSITDQLQNILINNRNIDLFYKNKEIFMCDIRDGAIYESVRADNPGEILSLTINIDGVQPSKGCQTTIWPILLVINEIPPNLRFKLENVVLAAVWPGPSKPSRDEVRLLFRPAIDELIHLENGHPFHLSDGNIHILHVYLIGACCDKPAQALSQCISEPTAAFGCGRCEVEGFVVPTAKGGHVRSFSTSYDDLDDICTRSNQRYDQLIDLIQMHQQLKALLPYKKRLKDASIDQKNGKGIVG
ncbi:unnamed protein product, partial [Rotaria sp. Silwood1]